MISGSVGAGQGTEVPGVGADSRRPFRQAAEPRDDLSPARARAPGVVGRNHDAIPSCDSHPLFRRDPPWTAGSRRATFALPKGHGITARRRPSACPVASTQHRTPRKCRAVLDAGRTVYRAIRSAQLPNEETVLESVSSLVQRGRLPRVAVRVDGRRFTGVGRFVWEVLV